MGQPIQVTGVFERARRLIAERRKLTAPNIADVGRTLYQSLATEAAQVIATDRATLDVDTRHQDYVIRLVPRNRLAAPLDICLDSSYQVTCVPGRSDMTIEIFSKDAGELAAEVQFMARAVIAGRYSELVSDTGRRSRVVSEWTDGAATTRHAQLNTFRKPKHGDPGWKSVTYQSY